MKRLVETAGDFMLIDPSNGTQIPHDRPSIVSATSFVDSRILSKGLIVLADDLPDTVTDADFAAAYAKDKNWRTALGLSEPAPAPQSKSDPAVLAASAKAKEEAEFAEALKAEEDEAAAKAKEEADAKTNKKKR